jgi:hypothetical protein
LAACGGDDTNLTLIGATCKKSSECDVTGVCITDGKDGLCSLSCTSPGAAGACPVGAYCDRGQFTTDQESGEQTLCLPACTKQSDCRDGYECNGVSSGPGKVCQPK